MKIKQNVIIQSQSNAINEMANLILHEIRE